MMTSSPAVGTGFNPAAFLSRLEERGVNLWLDEGGRLRYRAPAGTITPPVAARIKKARPQLLPLLRERAAFDGIADPFDGTEPALPDDPHSYPPRAPRSREAGVHLLAEARRGNLPKPPGYEGDPNTDVLALFAAFDQAHAADEAQAAEQLAGDILDWAAWWHGIEQRIGPSLYRPGDGNAPRIVWHDPAIHGLTFAEAEREA